jgi:hypothetical protein
LIIKTTRHLYDGMMISVVVSSSSIEEHVLTAGHLQNILFNKQN